MLLDALGTLVRLEPPAPLLAAALRRGRVTVLSGGRSRAGFGYGPRPDGDDGVWDVDSWEEPPRRRGELEGEG